MRKVFPLHLLLLLTRQQYMSHSGFQEQAGARRSLRSMAAPLAKLAGGRLQRRFAAMQQSGTRRLNTIYIVAGLIVLCLLPVPVPAGERPQGDEPGGEVVARVNGAPIYKRDLDETLALRFNKRRKMGMQPDNIQPEVGYAIQMQVLDELIDSAVLYQAVKATEGLPDVEEKVRQKILSLAATFGSEEKYEEFLSTKNSSLEKKKEYFRKRYQVQAYFDKLGLTKPEIPEKEIKDLYENQKRGFKIPEKVKLSQVYLEVPADASAEQKKKIAGYAQEAQRLLRDGKAFAEVARQLSDKYDDAKISGGERGYIGKGTLPEKVDEVAFSIMPWKISDVLESEFGFHVVMISEKKPAGFTPYEKVRDFLLKYLETERVQGSVAEHTRKLRSEADIEILLKKEPETEAEKS